MSKFNEKCVEYLASKLTCEDFEQLDLLNTACKKEKWVDIEGIMIGYFEKRPNPVYTIAQCLMARVYVLEVP